MFQCVAQRTTKLLERGAIAHGASLRRAFSNSIPSLHIHESHENGLRLAHSVEPIPFTDDLEITPVNTTSKMGHKKITVVGCGQVGMAIAYSLLNQQMAGTIALVDFQREKPNSSSPPVTD